MKDLKLMAADLEPQSQGADDRSAGHHESGQSGDHHHHSHHQCCGRHQHGDHDHPPHGHHHHGKEAVQSGPVLVIRPNSGLSGDMMVAGLLALSGQGQAGLDQYLKDLGLTQIVGRVQLVDRQVNEVGGLALAHEMPQEHQHRNLGHIQTFFSQSALKPKAQELALKVFMILAEAEGAVHGRPIEEVHFHEVGALDSIMDIGLVAALVADLAPTRLVCGPLPICDGIIKCEHGLLPAPAPAVLKMLTGVPVVPLASYGETITPTALALLKGLEVEFGPWPSMIIERQALIYGGRVLKGVPNGAIFALGSVHQLR